MMRRFLAAIVGLAVLTIFVAGPIHEFLDSIAWHLDDPGPISSGDAYAITVGLVLLLYASASAIVATWSGAAGLRALIVSVLAAPATLAFVRLFLWSKFQLFAGTSLAHLSMLAQYFEHLVYAAFHLTVVVLLANLPIFSRTRLTSASG